MHAFRRSSDSECDSPARAEVLAALAEDARCRVPGVTAGLYALGELAPFARLGHGIPVIRHTQTWDRYRPALFARAADDAEFRCRLRRAAPYLENFDLKAHGLCLAGGAASALLMRSDEDREKDYASYHDFDLFLVGHESDDAARAAIRALQCHLYEQWGGEGRAEAYRSQGCITFHSCDPCYPAAVEAPGTPADEPEAHYLRDPPPAPGRSLIQVILRRYATAAEVIHGFDLGSSAALWDGETLRVTALGKIAFERGANVLNLAARRNSYERRLARYFSRGFDLALPDLSGLELLEAGGRLPYLYCRDLRHEGCACGLWAEAVFATRPEHDNYGRAPDAPDWGAPPAEASDYALGSIAYGSRPEITRRNIRALGGPVVWAASLCACAPLTPGLDVFGIEPEVDVDILADLIIRAFRGGNVQLKALSAYAGPDAALELVLDHLTSQGSPPPREQARVLAARRWAALGPLATIPFAFMTVEDKTALTGPFPRCLVSAEEWYGGAYQRD